MYFTKEFRLHSIEDTTFVTYKINNLESNKKKTYLTLVLSGLIQNLNFFFSWMLSQSVCALNDYFWNDSFTITLAFSSGMIRVELN